MKTTSRFEDALPYAAHLHRGQMRKGTTIPYVGHLLGVASLVNDAVEDQGGSPRLEDIRARFGERVAAIVEGCTDADTIPKPPWRERKEAYLTHLREAAPDVLRVSAADKLYNARAILGDYRELGEALWPRFNTGRDEILWYYRGLADIFLALGERGPARLAGELDRTVTEIERLAARSTPRAS